MVKSKKSSIAILVRHIRYFSAFNKKQFYLGILLSYINACLQPAFIYLNGLLINDIKLFIEEREYISLLNIYLPSPAKTIFLILSLWIISRSIILLRDSIETRFFNNIFYNGYYNDLLDKLHSLNAKEVESKEIIESVNLVNNFWWQRASNFYNRLNTIGSSLIQIIITFLALYNVDATIALLVLILPLPEIIKIANENIKQRNFSKSINVDNVTSLYIVNLLSDIRTFSERKINGLYSFLKNKLESIEEVLCKRITSFSNCRNRNITIFSVIDRILLDLIKILSILKLILKRLEIGSFLAVFGYIDSLYNQSLNFYTDVALIKDDIDYIDDLYTIFDHKGFADDFHGKSKLKMKGPPTIELRNFSFTYPNENNKIISNVNMVVKPFQKILILGEDGSGKSSLIKSLCGLYPVERGTLFYNGIDIYELDRHEVKRRISLVPEDFARFFFSIKENILLGDISKPYDENLYRKALEITGLKKWILDNGINEKEKPLGNYFADSIQISSGHWQRLALARAIYRDRDIFILDQPFTYIDKKSSNQIIERLFNHLSNKTVIFIGEQVTHVDYFDCIYEMKKGTINQISKGEAVSKWG